MTALPSDISLVGTVLALAIAILLLSGLALYVAFRLRETLRDEKGGNTRAVKVAFLIGLLFLSGGVFYFFASGFNPSGGNPTTQVTTSALTSLASSTTTARFSSSAASTTTTTAAQGVTMPAPACSSNRVKSGATFTCYVDIYDSGSATYASSTLVSSGGLTKFAFVGCTESVNGGSASPVSCSGSTVAAGTIVPNTIVLTLTIQAPSQSGQYSNCVLTLNANGLQPVSATFSIQVTA